MSELKEALTDVRRAYRLLWAYQRHVLDIVRVIADGFDTHEFYVWETMNADRPPRRTTDPTSDRWAWDMLPMYQVSFLFLPENADRNAPKKREWMLEVAVQSDDAFDDPETGEEPDPKDFVDAAEATSAISLVAWECTADANVNWLSGVWEELEWPDEDEVVIEHSKPPMRVLAKAFPLEGLANKDAVNRAVADFKRLLHTKMGVNTV